MGEAKLHWPIPMNSQKQQGIVEAYFRQRYNSVDSWEDEILSKGGRYQDYDYTLKHCARRSEWEVVHLLLLNFRFPGDPKYIGYLFVSRNSISGWDEAGNIESDSWSDYRSQWKEIKANVCSY